MIFDIVVACLLFGDDEAIFDTSIKDFVVSKAEKHCDG